MRLAELVRPLITEKMPVMGQSWPSRFDFGQPLDLDTVQWVRPELVAHVRYLAWTGDGLLRQPSYLGLREDERHRATSAEAGRSRIERPKPNRKEDVKDKQR
jgi:ATP-dependent DNA ligase